MHMLLSKTLRLFLDGLGRREEYEYYLGAFQASEGGCFAALIPDLASLEESSELMVFDLRFLLQVELSPMVLLCGPQAREMAERLAGYGRVLEFAECGMEESIPAVAGRLLAAARKRKRVPLLSLPHAGIEEAVVALVPERFRRVHVLRAQGGLRDSAGDLIWYHWLKGRNPEEPAPEESPLLATATACLEHYPSLHFSVASPLNLLKELFTVRGAGSIIRPGSRILHAERAAEVDLERLKLLLEDAFGRSLVRTEFLKGISDFYIEERYRGAALLEPHPAGRYLSKFAVGMQARGEGLALELWNELMRDHKAMFWRSLLRNPINTFYERHAEGRQQVGPWQIFWRGVASADLPAVIDYAANLPADFAPADNR